MRGADCGGVVRWGDRLVFVPGSLPVLYWLAIASLTEW